MKLSNGTEVFEIQRDGYKEAICAEDPHRAMTEAEWKEYSRRVLRNYRRAHLRAIKARKTANFAAFEARRTA